jgi:hypothetical protein
VCPKLKPVNFKSTELHLANKSIARNCIVVASIFKQSMKQFACAVYGGREASTKDYNSSQLILVTRALNRVQPSFLPTRKTRCRHTSLAIGLTNYVMVNLLTCCLML